MFRTSRVLWFHPHCQNILEVFIIFVLCYFHTEYCIALISFLRTTYCHLTLSLLGLWYLPRIDDHCPSNSIVNVTELLLNVAISYFVQLSPCLLAIQLLLINDMTEITLRNKFDVKQNVSVHWETLLPGGTLFPLCVKCAFTTLAS